MDVQYTAGYFNNTNTSFRICDLPDNRIGGIKNSVYCVINNILIRGCPTIPATSLIEALQIESFDPKNLSASDKRRLDASIRLQLTVLRLLMADRLSLDGILDIAVRTNHVEPYEQAAIDDLLKWISHLFALADLSFAVPSIQVQRVDSFDHVDYGIAKIAIELDESSVEDDSEFGLIKVLPMYEQNVDYSVLEITDPIKYSFSKNEEEKDNALRFVLKNIFGFDEFWPGQERIIKNALRRRDTIGVLPTGSGKSLCYQMCALLQPCLTICIAPIKSLMVDQCQNLRDFAITRVAYISSDLSTKDRNTVTENFKSHRYILTYMAPERFQSQPFRLSLTKMMDENGCKYGHIVIDEVHCMSEWGHSFRTSYLNLIKTCKKYCGDTVLFGLTATASENVLRNIKVEFGMKNDENVISNPSFTRKELDFRVISVAKGSNKYNELNKLLERYMYYHNDLLSPKGKESMCGIVFTPFASNKHILGCAKLAQDLSKKYEMDIRCFAGEKPNGWDDEQNWEEYKRNAQNDFKDNDYTMIVATKAFGVGIDKKNVRYAIHYGLPSSLESLYQEAGRAGRDKKPAQCIIIYDRENSFDWNNFKRVLDPKSSVEELQEVVKQMGFKGGDLARQMFLFSNNALTYSDEILCANYIVRNIRNGKYCIGQQKGPKGVFFSREMIEKVTYHLSVIGVIEDWTVDWVNNQITVIPRQGYTLESLCEEVNNSIKNYASDARIDPEDPFFKRNDRFPAEILVLAQYYHWYHEKIIGNRKQALYNLVEACNEFEKSGPEEFKNKIEAYFRLSDLTFMISQVANEEDTYANWFKVFDLARAENTSDGDLAINLGRFLESFQNNLAIDYLSGMANLFAGSFESLNGRRRLESAMESINEMDMSDRIEILNHSMNLVAERNNTVLNEQFSEFMIHNLMIENIEELLYQRLQDDYSLSTYMKKVMSRLAVYAGEREND